MTKTLGCWVALAALALSGCDSRDTGEPTEDQRGDGTATIELAEFPDRPYWGDTHLHTCLLYTSDAADDP